MAENNIGNVDPLVTRRKKQRSYVSPRNEFWQGPEIAHRVVFGYGYLTWEWKEGLRGWTAPLIYAISYKLLAFFGLDTSTTVVMAPRIIQSVFASFGDLFLYKLAVKNFDIQTGTWTLICYLLSWFTFYNVTRTLTNSLETVLTTVALFYWPLKANEEIDVKLLIKALGFAALSSIIRPTAAIIWIPLCARHLFLTLHKLRFIFEHLLPVGCLAMLWSLVLNSWLYKRFTFVELNFVKFNVLNNMGTFYGSHPWHWYFTQGFPVVIFTHLIPFVGGILKASPHQRLLGWLILWVISIYSFLSHKEFRFIFPVLPLAMCYCGLFLSSLCDCQLRKNQAAHHQLLSGMKAKLLVLFLAVTNVPMALYTSTVHQRGSIDVMGYIRDESFKPTSDDGMSVLFLMPCHSTPFFSYVHRNISMRILECPPSDKQGYLDEADKFYLNPSAWLTKQFGDQTEHRDQIGLPSHIVMYNVLLPKVAMFLDQFHYKKDATFFHTHFPEGRVGSQILVFKQGIT
ncbi:PREDICTED: GPI mannosyltransferase 3-like isoform X2 [Acropora digitifera]|uniref:GPI mannosyltransferase 3-like isoform X2 n=1 Tax=Acropora digitifera TaxID=70779 RepID=UPI00077A84C4|nr:PREDICTED: GPI mannosyltransferase 3-like isoform X2 [Acropora digitifera]